MYPRRILAGGGAARSAGPAADGPAANRRTEIFTMYLDYAIDLIVNVTAIFLLAYVLYFRRHRRADLLLAYVALNIGVFVTMSLLSTVRVDVALGFGLFAILSIIRLRSTSVTQQEVAYYFVALVLGLVNGIGIDDRQLVVLLNAVLLVTTLLVDGRGLRAGVRRVDVTLDVVHTDDATLLVDVERRRPIRVTLDIVHADEAALVADLGRRLGGRVLRHQVRDVDYMRVTTVVDVRYRAGSPVAPRVAS
jgi:fluoride ion exporter CrcB/FEX